MLPGGYGYLFLFQNTVQVSRLEQKQARGNDGDIDCQCKEESAHVYRSICNCFTLVRSFIESVNSKYDSTNSGEPHCADNHQNEKGRLENHKLDRRGGNRSTVLSSIFKDSDK